jgi:hypothetical protein
MPIIDFTPIMTDYNVPAPNIVSASSEYNNFSFLSWKAMDNNNSTYTLFNAATGWWKVHLFSAYVLYSYSLRANAIPEPNRMPKDWTLQGSNDNVSWTILDTRTNETAWDNAEVRTYICTPRGRLAFSYFMLDVTANNGDASYCQICELRLQLSISYNYLHSRRDRMNMRGVSTQNSLA